MRISIGFKLMALVGVSTLILVVVGLYGTWSAWHSIHEINEELGKATDTELRILTMQHEYKTEVQEWKNVLLRSTDEASLKARWDIYEAQHLKVKEAATEMAKQVTNEQARDLLKAFIEQDQSNHEQYKKAVLILKERNFDNRPADTFVHGIDRPTAKYIEQAGEAISREAEKIGVDTIEHAESGVQQSLVLGAIVFLLEGALCMLLIWRFIIRPTGIVLTGLNTLKSGDFTGTLPRLSNDELGDIANATQQVSQELGKLVTSVRIAADRLAQTAQRVAMVSSMTSEGVKNQREETDNASQAMNSMSQSMVASVQSAHDAVSIAERVSNQVSVVNNVLDETVNAVQTLAEGVKNTAHAIQVLKDETQSIGSVAKTIRGIADQTNLLALNAAIEAARAGEQGRGFAVVADEVRKLAQITQDATGNIEQRLGALQTGASNAMAAMMDGCDRADKSVVQAREAREVLDSITQAAASICETNEKIVAILESQKGVAGNISSTILNISQVAEQTSHSSRQTSEEIANVAAEAVHLDNLVNKFVVTPGDQEQPQYQTEKQSDSVELF